MPFRENETTAHVLVTGKFDAVYWSPIVNINVDPHSPAAETSKLHLIHDSYLAVLLRSSTVWTIYLLLFSLIGLHNNFVRYPLASFFGVTRTFMLLASPRNLSPSHPLKIRINVSDPISEYIKSIKLDLLVSLSSKFCPTMLTLSSCLRRCSPY